MDTYLKTVTVSIDDLDDLNHVNNIKYIEWIQDVSAEHWANVVDLELSRNYVWVVRNHNIHYHKSALIDEELLIRTFVANWKGALSIRQVEIIKERTNELLVSAATEWCLLDAKTLRPKRIPEEIIKRFN